MRKFIAIIILFCICIFLFIFGWYSVSIGKPNDTYGYMQKLIPYEVREVLRKTIFIIPDLKRTIERQKTTIEEQQKRHINLINNITNNIDDFNIYYSAEKNINSKFNTYSIKTYPLPFPNRFNFKSKPIAYIDQTIEKIILVVGNGVFFSINKEDINSTIHLSISTCF